MVCINIHLRGKFPVYTMQRLASQVGDSATCNTADSYLTQYCGTQFTNLLNDLSYS
jgi:hypothetical protein